MATREMILNERLKGAWDRLFFSLDSNVQKTITENEEFQKNMIHKLPLTENEKNFLLNELQRVWDRHRVRFNSTDKLQCKFCQNWHLAIRYCESCIRKYLENNFGNWTSGNDEIDKLIKECQKKTVSPRNVIEWISYDQFENIEYLTEGGYATIYTANWKDGYYFKWNSEKQILERLGGHKVILKSLNDSNSNNVKWFQEVTFNFTLDKTFQVLAKCFGLTKDPKTKNYMLVMYYYNYDLRRYLKDNYHTLKEIQKYRIIYRIAGSLVRIHGQNILHRDLHSGNILCSRHLQWYVSDLGLSGPVDKPLNNNSIYGNLPYVAPEVFRGQIYTKKSDIYSLGILMWEVITGEIPFDEHEHSIVLQVDIINGYRPEIYKNIPQEYADLMKQCWDGNPDNRPDANTIYKKMELLIKSIYNEMGEMNEMDEMVEMDKKQGQIIIPERLAKKNIKLFKKAISKAYSFGIQTKSQNSTDDEQKSFDSFDSQLNDLIFSEEMEKQLYKSSTKAKDSHGRKWNQRSLKFKLIS
ncbi:hypothetical protein Glove_11g29 [Diversispora epigaea]|uniref:Protein kinase domain-containing protein n=1 Tax=Diversispora epigaea TaxID=1348612 RepID=A0A397JN29_9GLOM|nr:hypothetical protein Glove_11g29 [Diversispora epigaea]